MTGLKSNPPGAELALDRRLDEGDLIKTVNQPVRSHADNKDRELLVRMDSANAGEVAALGPRSVRIGRSPDCELCIDDEGLSRKHARLTRLGTDYALEDLNSSNGTFVNGQRVQVHQLKYGDTLQFGPRVCFRYTVASGEEERVLRQLYEASVRDPMTRAYNRQFFDSQLQNELSFARRHDTALSLLIFDVDHFKQVNDTYGHVAGDTVLKAIADVTDKQLRREDLFARYGGEEFVILLRDVPLDGGFAVAERLRKAIAARSIECEGTQISVTVSIGCASLACCNNQTVEALIRRADGRLYKAKLDGRNRTMASD